MKKYCLSLVPAQLIFLYSSEPRDGAAHSGLGPSTSVISQYDLLQTRPQSDLGSYSMAVPSSWFTLTGCVKLAIRSKHDRILLDVLL